MLHCNILLNTFGKKKDIEGWRWTKKEYGHPRWRAHGGPTAGLIRVHCIIAGHLLYLILTWSSSPVHSYFPQCRDFDKRFQATISMKSHHYHPIKFIFTHFSCIEIPRRGDRDEWLKNDWNIWPLNLQIWISILFFFSSSLLGISKWKYFEINLSLLFFNHIKYSWAKIK